MMTGEKGTTMFEKTVHGTEIIKREENTAFGYEVALTRKTTKGGNVRHGVVITNLHTGIRTRLKTYRTLAPAFNLYKSMLLAE